jgi:hypothetical protein
MTGLVFKTGRGNTEKVSLSFWQNENESQREKAKNRRVNLIQRGECKIL